MRGLIFGCGFRGAAGNGGQISGIRTITVKTALLLFFLGALISAALPAIGETLDHPPKSASRSR